MIDSVAHNSATTAATAATGLRPYSKRQQVMQELMGDSELLLKDRLEVRHLMTHNPVTILPTTTIEEMTKLMRTCGCTICSCATARAIWWESSATAICGPRAARRPSR